MASNERESYLWYEIALIIDGGARARFQEKRLGAARALTIRLRGGGGISTRLNAEAGQLHADSDRR